MLRRFFASVFLVLVMAPSACARGRDVGLLQVGELSRVELDRGDSLQVECAGIATGQQVTVTLTGDLCSPDKSAERVHLQLPGRATSERAVEVSDLGTLWERAGARATFVGRVRIDAALRFAETRATGDAAATLEMRSTADGSLGIEAARARRAEQLLRGMGATVGTLDERGLAVQQVWAASAAEQVGLIQGDRIIAANGVTVLSMADLGGTSLESLRVLRGGDVHELRVSSFATRGGVFGWVMVLLLGLVGAGLIRWAIGRPSVRSLYTSPSRAGGVLALGVALCLMSLATVSMFGGTLASTASVLPLVLCGWGCVGALFAQLTSLVRFRLSVRGLLLASVMVAVVVAALEGIESFGQLSMGQVGVSVAFWIAALLSQVRREPVAAVREEQLPPVTDSSQMVAA